MDAAPSSYYHHPPPPSHYPYYELPPPSAQPPPPLFSHFQPPPPPLSHLPPPPPYSHSQQPPPPPGSHYAVPPSLPHQEEVRTLFVAGLPDDCKPREIYNLFRDFPGYQSCHLRGSTDTSQPYAFAVFADRQSAVAALHSLNGLVFDFEDDATLYIELAKSNSKSTKRLRTGVGSNRHMSGIGNSAYSTNDYPSTQSHTTFDYAASQDVDFKKMAFLASKGIIHQRSCPATPQQNGLAVRKNHHLLDAIDSKTYLPQNNPPCPTLFVANLGPNCSEQVLAQIFSKYSGFLKLKVQNKNGVPVAFVNFEDIASSTEALNNLKGTDLPSSFGEPLRIEYAKSRMGLRKRER